MTLSLPKREPRRFLDRPVTHAPSPHRPQPQPLRRVDADGRVWFLTQDGWIPERPNPANSNSNA